MQELNLEHVVNVLERTPSLLEVMLKNLPKPMVFANEGSGTWSPFDVVGHLVHGEKTDWIPRTRIILEYGESRAFDPFDREAMLQTSIGKSMDVLLTEFATLRRESLNTLQSLHLSKSDLQRKGKHPALGVVTLGQHLSSWAVHDLDHVAQILRTIAKSQDHVGPWKAYLSILSDRQ